jgi:hypothetical protein
VRCLSLLLALWIPATAQVAPMLNLVVVEGEGAVNNIRQRTAREPIVQVQDENHKPVAGAIVVFTLPSNGAGGTFANGAHTLTVATDTQGQAVAHGLKPNGVQGQFKIHVNASHNGQNTSLDIAQANAIAAGTAGAAAAGGISAKLIIVLAVVAGAAAGGAYYATHSGGSSNTATAIPGTTISATGGTVGPPR